MTILAVSVVLALAGLIIAGRGLLNLSKRGPKPQERPRR